MSSPLPGALMQSEIASQGLAWGQLLPLLRQQAADARPLFDRVQDVLFTGCGSGLNAACFAAPLFQSQAAIGAHSAPAADCFLFPDTVLLPSRKTVAVLVSRSGQTTEVVEAMETLRQRGARTLAVTCTPDSPLASRCDAALLLTPAEERAVVTTRSFTGMLLAIQVLAAVVSGDRQYLALLSRLPSACQDQMEVSLKLGRGLADRGDLSTFTFLGNGAYYGLARECQLKIKETCLLAADAYPLLDYRHGPQSTVQSGLLLTALLSDRGREAEERFLRDMKRLGATTLALCDQASPSLRHQADYLLEVGPDLDDRTRGPLYMPAIQALAACRALALGLNPDHPRHLSYWIDTSAPASHTA